MNQVRAMKKRLDAKVAGRMYRSFMKATENMADEKRNQIIDQHVMSYVHHLLHDIGDHARGHKQADQEIAQANQVTSAAKAKQSNLEGEIRNVLEKIVKEFADFKISNPEQIPHVYHMVEHHPVLQSVIMAIAAHEMTVDQGVRKVIREIEQEKEHHVTDLSTSKEGDFQKSSASMFGMFGAYSFPSYPIAFSSSALSRFRPSPPFLRDTTECPDERFIKMIMKTKHDGSEEETRPVQPADNSHVDLAERAGIPHYLIAGNKVEKAQKCSSVSSIKKKMAKKDAMRLRKSETITQRMEADEVWKGNRAHAIRRKNG